MTEETSLMGDLQDENETSQGESSNEKSFQVNGMDVINPKTYDRPDDIEDSMWDAETNMFKSDELYKAWKTEKDKALNLRKTISKGVPKSAEKIEDFTIDNAEELGIDPSDDKLDVMKNIALESGLSNQQFQKMLNAFNKAGKDGKFDFEDVGEDFEGKEKERVASEMELLGKDGHQVIANVKSWGKKLLNDGVLSKEDFEAYSQFGVTAQQIRVLDKLRQVSGYIDDFPVNAQAINGSYSEDEIETMMADPRYQTDAGYRNKIYKWFEDNA